MTPEGREKFVGKFYFYPTKATKQHKVAAYQYNAEKVNISLSYVTAP
jgi:hypothetical protein